MLFSSVTFLFCFLPCVTILYYIINPVLRNVFLLLMSLLFYAWGEPKYLSIMLLVILINYIAGLLIDALPKYKRCFLWISILSNLGILSYYKYTDFIIASINSAVGTQLALHHIALPIGISFYIFQSLSYVIDLYRDVIKVQYNIINFALYVSLFPQLIAGPIVKYKDIANEICNRSESLEDIAVGIRRFIVGLSKKVLLANSMGEVADKVFLAGPNDINMSIAWLGAICYSLQIFFDFSGYSDMAIGLGRIFGFHFLENFNYPYIAISVTDFWRRWHMSLSTWFKEYLYIPLGGNRVSNFRNNINLIIVFFATGLWHGASWNFVVWGLWHGFFLIVEKRFFNIKENDNCFSNILKHCYVIIVFVLGWVFFRSDNLTNALNYILVMLGLKTNNTIGFELLYYLNQKVLIMAIVSILLCCPWNNLYAKVKCCPYFFLIKDFILLIMLLASVASIAASGYNPFIYFRF